MSAIVCRESSSPRRSGHTLWKRCASWWLLSVLVTTLGVMAQQSPKSNALAPEPQEQASQGKAQRAVRSPRRGQNNQRPGRNGNSVARQELVSVGGGQSVLRTQWTNYPSAFAVASLADMKKFPMAVRSGAVPKLGYDSSGSAGGRAQGALPKGKSDQTNAASQNGRRRSTVALQPTVGRTFQGIIERRGIVPPDTTATAGPSHILEMTNDDVGIFSKSGVKLQQVALEQFFGSLNPTFIFDPRVLFDQYTGRFMALALDGFRSPNSSIFLAVSQTSDPTGAWFFYRFDADRDGNTQTNNWADFTDLGVDQDAVYFAANMFSNNDFFQYSKVWVVPKAQLLTGTANVNFTEFSQINNVFTFRACHTFGNTPGEFLVSYNGGPNLRVWRVTNPLATPTLTNLGNITVPIVSQPPAPMPNNFDFLNDFRLLNAVFQNGSVWTAHSVNTGDGKSSVRWYELDVINLQTKQMGTINEPVAQWWYYPAVAVNSLGDMVMTLSGSSTSTFPGTYVTTHLSADPPGFTHPVTLVKTGEAANFSGRWGDYASAALDPADPNQRTFWIAHEYSLTGGNWGTWIAQAVLPDLNNSDVTVSSFNILPANSARGTQLTASVSVTNTGKGFTGDFVVDLYRNRSSAPPSGAAGDMRQTVTGGLALGETKSLTFTFTPTTLGQFQGWIQADTLNQVAEGTETNNVSGPLAYNVSDAFVYDTFTDTNGKALQDHTPNINLPLDRWTISPSNASVVIQGNAVGASAAFGFVSAVIDSGQTKGIIEADARFFNFAGLLFRQSSPETYFAFRIDGSAPEGEQLALVKVQNNIGTYLARRSFQPTNGVVYNLRVVLNKAKIQLFVDGVQVAEVIDEFNENVARAGLIWGFGSTTYDNFAAFTDQATQPVLPDVMVQSLSIAPTASTPGTQLTATIVVKNDGTSTENGFMVDFYENLSSAPASGKAGNKRFTVPPLGQGASTTLTHTFTPSEPGSLKAWAQVDTDSKVSESNETNNVFGPSGYIVANALVQDTFTDTDGKLIGPTVADHVPDVNQPGGRWDVTGPLPVVVQTGEARVLGSGNGLVSAVINGGAANGSLDVDTRVVGDALLYSGVQFRRTDASNYFFARADSSDVGNELGIARVQNGVPTFLAKAPFSLVSGATYHWRVEFSGATLRVFFGGAQQFDLTDNFNQAASQCGLLWNAVVGGQNTAFDNFIVTGTPQADVTVQSLSISPLIAAPNTNLTATVVVKNHGSAAAGSFVVDFYKHLTSAPGAVPGDDRKTVSSLAAGATATLTFTFTQAAEGNYQAWAQVDTDGALAESKENNNVTGPLNYTAANTITENVRDTFTGADGTFLNQHTPDVNKPGGAWSVTGPVSAQLQGNMVKVAGTGSGFVMATINSNAANGKVEADTQLSSSGLLYSGIIFRSTNANNFFAARLDSSDTGGQLALVRVQNSVGTYLRRTAEMLTASSAHRWRVELSGATIKVFLNDVMRFEVTDSFNQSATQHGLQWFAANGGQNTTFDNFKMTPDQNPNRSTGGRHFSPGLHLLSLPPTAQSGQALSAAKLARWNNAVGGYSATNVQDSSAGTGYWARFDSDVTLTAPTDTVYGPFTFSLTSGWNLIGYPFLAPMAVDWNAMQVQETDTGISVSFRDAVQRGWIDRVMWTYQAQEGYRVVHPTFPDALRTFEPWQGYWVRTTRPVQLTLSPPNAVRKNAARASRRAPALNDWSLTLFARDGNGGQDSCVLGVSQSLQGDGAALKPPPAPEASPTVYFPNGQPLPYGVNVRQSINNQTAWDVEVLPAHGSSSVTLDWSNMTGVPNKVRLTLIDTETNKRYYMRTQNGVTVNTNGAPRRFQLIASSDAGGRRLLNALNTTGGRGEAPVLVSFVLGSDAHVMMDVISPTGKLITHTPAAARRSLGLNTLTWNGKDARGRVLARGLYILRVTATDDEGKTMSLTRTVPLGR